MGTPAEAVLHLRKEEACCQLGVTWEGPPGGHAAAGCGERRGSACGQRTSDTAYGAGWLCGGHSVRSADGRRCGIGGGGGHRRGCPAACPSSSECCCPCHSQVGAGTASHALSCQAFAEGCCPRNRHNRLGVQYQDAALSTSQAAEQLHIPSPGPQPLAFALAVDPYQELQQSQGSPALPAQSVNRVKSKATGRKSVKEQSKPSGPVGRLVLAHSPSKVEELRAAETLKVMGTNLPHQTRVLDPPAVSSDGGSSAHVVPAGTKHFILQDDDGPPDLEPDGSGIGVDMD